MDGQAGVFKEVRNKVERRRYNIALVVLKYQLIAQIVPYLISIFLDLFKNCTCKLKLMISGMFIFYKNPI